MFMPVLAELTDTEILVRELVQQVEVPHGSLTYQFEESGAVTSIGFKSPLLQCPFTMAVGPRQGLPSRLTGVSTSRVPMSIFQFLDEKSPTAEEWPLATFVCVDDGPNIYCKMGTTQMLVQVHPQILTSTPRTDFSNLLVKCTPNLHMLFDDINLRLRMMSGIGG